MAQKKTPPRSRVRRTSSEEHYLTTIAKGILAWVGTLGIMALLGFIMHFLLQL